MPLRLSHTALLAAGLLSLSASGHAQPPGPPPGEPMPMGGPATRAELKTMLEARFDARDANHDGKLDEQDPKARQDQRLAAMFDRVDTDHNGSISKAEFAAAREHGPEGLRADGPPEGPMGPRRAMMFRHEGPMGGPEGDRLEGPPPFRPMPGAFMRRGPGAMPGGPAGAPEGPITKSDFVARGLAMFDRVDTNHDGKISPAERDAARGSMRDHRGRAPMAPPPPNTPQSGQ